jgi:hypothetical protein
LQRLPPFPFRNTLVTCEKYINLKLSIGRYHIPLSNIWKAERFISTKERRFCVMYTFLNLLLHFKLKGDKMAVTFSSACVDERLPFRWFCGSMVWHCVLNCSLLRYGPMNSTTTLWTEILLQWSASQPTWAPFSRTNTTGGMSGSKLTTLCCPGVCESSLTRHCEASWRVCDNGDNRRQ